MQVIDFLRTVGAEFYTGVPDSLLRPLCDHLLDAYGEDPRRHLIAANEGNCVALAAGYHFATGKVPLVYLQNSGEGNAVNPLASLLNGAVYAVPCVFVVGWRGEPGVPDEPQHRFQGEVTVRLLETLDVSCCVVGKETTVEELRQTMDGFQELLAAGKQVAFVVRKGALTYDGRRVYRNGYSLTREEAIRRLLAVSGEDAVVCTTGKASRELFELREASGVGHGRDFLTVGSMGHSSSIALGAALQKPEKKFWCLDGDGALLMHMGALAVIGSVKPQNLIHVLLNNNAHESVGGMPTAAGSVDLPAVAKACGYPRVLTAQTAAELETALREAKESRELTFLEVKCAIGARADLGRPTTSAIENKNAFMSFLNGSFFQ